MAMALNEVLDVDEPLRSAVCWALLKEAAHLEREVAKLEKCAAARPGYSNIPETTSRISRIARELTELAHHLKSPAVNVPPP